MPLYDDTLKTSPPVATAGLVGACVLVFLWQMGLPPRAALEAVYGYGMIPAVLFGSAELRPADRLVPSWATLITSQFLHGGIAHLLGNMLYLACGVVAALTQAYIDTAEQVPMIGASGAIAGVLGDYLVLNPRGNVAVLIWILLLIGLIAVAGPDAGIVVPGAAERTVSDEERAPGVRLRDVCRRIPRQYLPGGDPPAAANPIAAARPRPLLRRPVRGRRGASSAGAATGAGPGDSRLRRIRPVGDAGPAGVGCLP